MIISILLVITGLWLIHLHLQTKTLRRKNYIAGIDMEFILEVATQNITQEYEGQVPPKKLEHYLEEIDVQIGEFAKAESIVLCGTHTVWAYNMPNYTGKVLQHLKLAKKDYNTIALLNLLKN